MAAKIQFKTINPAKRFNEHLNLPQNKRIIFSGPFGSGKTCFIEDFFKNDKYEVVHLFPVNYSVSSNEDIFELIKFDIFFELLKFNEIFEKEDFSHYLTLQVFALNNAQDIAETIIKRVPKVGKSIAEVTGKVLSFLLKYKKFKKETTVDEESEVVKFIKEFIEKKGTIYEENSITELIQEFVSRLRTKGKESVLVIDDLDRIDPEHIFRLLNVFAAHIDLRTDDNKFGFDKILFVCDIKNIRNIFSSKYGANVDFSGYIDKFFSTEIFHFDNKDEIRERVSEFVSKVKIKNTAGKEYDWQNSMHHNICYLIEALISADVLNLRAIKKFENESYTVRDYFTPFVTKGNSKTYNLQYPFLVTLDFMSYILGSGTQLREAVEKVARYDHVNGLIDYNDRSHYHKLEQTLFLLGYNPQHQDEQPRTISVKVGTFEYHFNYSPYKEHGTSAARISTIKLFQPNLTISAQDTEIDSKVFFQLLLQLIEKLQSYGLLK